MGVPYVFIIHIRLRQYLIYSCIPLIEINPRLNMYCQNEYDKLWFTFFEFIKTCVYKHASITCMGVLLMHLLFCFLSRLNTLHAEKTKVLKILEISMSEKSHQCDLFKTISVEIYIKGVLHP